MRCTACDYAQQETVKSRALPTLEQDLAGKSCPKCTAPALHMADIKELIDDLAKLAEQVGSDVEVISAETEEGVMLRDSFGGIAAILRFKLPS